MITQGHKGTFLGRFQLFLGSFIILMQFSHDWTAIFQPCISIVKRSGAVAVSQLTRGQIVRSTMADPISNLYRSQNWHKGVRVKTTIVQKL